MPFYNQIINSYGDTAEQWMPSEVWEVEYMEYLADQAMQSFDMKGEDDE